MARDPFLRPPTPSTDTKIPISATGYGGGGMSPFKLWRQLQILDLPENADPQYLSQRTGGTGISTLDNHTI